MLLSCPRPLLAPGTRLLGHELPYTHTLLAPTIGQANMGGTDAIRMGTRPAHSRAPCAACAAQGRESPGVHTLVAVTTPELAKELLAASGLVPGLSPDVPLPPQTTQYLWQRAQKVWDALEPELCRARGASCVVPCSCARSGCVCVAAWVGGWGGMLRLLASLHSSWVASSSKQHVHSVILPHPPAHSPIPPLFPPHAQAGDHCPRPPRCSCTDGAVRAHTCGWTRHA